MKRLRMGKHQRRATTVVEMAVVAPLLVLLMFGFLELGYVFLLKQNITLAANRGARAALLPGASMVEVRENVDKAMHASGLTGYTVTSNIDELDPEDTLVTVEVAVPMDRKTFTGKLLGGGIMDISTKVTVWREGTEKHPQ